MKLVHPELDHHVNLFSDRPCEWVIESPQYFTKIVSELLNQKHGSEGEFTCFCGDTIVDITKKMEVIVDPFAVSINEKKVINKLYAQLNQLANSENFYLQTQEIKNGIYKYLLDLEQDTSYVLDLNEEMDLNLLFRSFDIKFEIFEEDFLDNLCRYMKVINEMLGIELIICVNLRSYLADDQLRTLLDDIKYADFCLLLIENQERCCMKDVNRYIIDKDLCEI